MIDVTGSGTTGRAVDGLAGPAGPLLSALTRAPGDADPDEDGEFRSALLAELVRRYLRVLRDHARTRTVPRVWQVVLDGETRADPVRSVLAGAYALVGHDLGPAVVTSCTLLGRAPGCGERAVVQMLLAVVAGLAREAATGADPITRADAAGLALLLGRGEGWRQAEHLWTVRGRPSEAAKERAALDWRAVLVARSLLGDG